MTDWRPIHCPYCRCWHEQPGAVKTVKLCREYCALHHVKVAPQPDLPDEKSEKV